jgi:UDP-N-acetylmuramyl pentapeptide phosphotransferase/UDP-N-acetylglucosamine-1-phosphate transferase
MTVAAAGLVLIGLYDLLPGLRGRAHRDLGAAQCAHDTPTPRLGGVAIAAGLLIGAYAWPPLGDTSFRLFLLTLAPLLAAGAAEDFGLPLSPTLRLLASAIAGLLFVWAFGEWLPRLDIVGVDWLLALSPLVAVPVTIFACAGVTHAFNIVDGLHGLAGGLALMAAAGLALVAREAGLDAHAAALWLLCAATAGFLAVNFPLGRLFLGDAGAYVLGHALAWIAVSMVARSADISAFAILLIFFWPVADTCLSMARRALSGAGVTEPDRRHFHQIVMAGLVGLSGGDRRRANPLAALVVVLLASAPVACGVLLWDRPTLATAAALLFGALFVASYLWLSGRWEVARGARTLDRAAVGARVRPLDGSAPAE